MVTWHMVTFSIGFGGGGDDDDDNGGNDSDYFQTLLSPET